MHNNNSATIALSSLEILSKRCKLKNTSHNKSLTGKPSAFACIITTHRLWHQLLPNNGLGSRNSVRPSVTRVDCDKTKWRTADILIPHERAITLLLWYQQWLVGDVPLPLKSALKVTHPLRKRRLRPISAHVSTVGDSKRSSITTNIKSTTGFPTSHRWSVYVTLSALKGGSKNKNP